MDAIGQYYSLLVFSALSAILSLVSNDTDDHLSVVDIGEAHGTVRILTKKILIQSAIFWPQRKTDSEKV